MLHKKAEFLISAPNLSGMGSHDGLRPGHYTVKSKQHGHECLRCGMKGFISDIKAIPCPNPTAEPVYPNEDVEVSSDQPPLPKTLPEDDHSHDLGLVKELEMLRGLEEELAFMNAIEEEKEQLEALEKEMLMMDVDKVLDLPNETGTTSPVHESVESKLVEMGFSRSIASWAAETSHGWSAALDKAFTRTQEEEYMELLKAEKEEEDRIKKEKKEARIKKEEEESRNKREEEESRNKREEEEASKKKEEGARKKEASELSKSARPPATPCSSPGQPPKPTKMLPPAVPLKKPDVETGS